MLLHSRFDPEEIEREKGVIVEEMNMYRDTPAQYLPDVYDDLCFGDTPLGRHIIGNKDSIRGGDPRHLHRLPRLAGTPPSAPSSGSAARLERRRHRRGWRSASATRPVFDTGDTSRSGATGRHARACSCTRRTPTSSTCASAATVCPIGHPDRYVVQLPTTVLGGGMSSRLFSEVRERRGLAYYVFAQHGQYLDAGSLYAQAGVDLARADEAVRTILAELRKLRDEPVPADELAKAKSYLRGRLVLGLEDPRSIISFGLRGLGARGRAPRADRGARRDSPQ